MKHGFFSLKQFLSHITKFPRDFWSSGIFPFTGIYLAGFLHSPRFFFPLAGFFIPFDLNLWSLFKIRRFLKKWLEDFSLLVKKLSNIHVNVHPAGFFHSPFKSVFFMKECHSSLQTEGGMTHSHNKGFLIQKHPFIPVRDFSFISCKYLNFICFVENLRTSLRKSTDTGFH